MSKVNYKDIKVRDLKHEYDSSFVPSEEYLRSMPDIQNKEYNNTPIDFVGISEFHIPIRILQKDGNTQEVQASISGLVSLEAFKRGINMSRIIRTFYKSADQIMDFNALGDVLHNYQDDLNSLDAHIQMNFQYRIWQDALRSVQDDGIKEGGWQYYNVTFDANLDHDGEYKKIMWFDYVYSSACPCSTELSTHAALNRGVFAIPHSQRSIARIGIEFGHEPVWIEDMLDMCRSVIPTETLVFCKRQDEQAFAELNGANPIFVEDAIRKLASILNENELIEDFKIICSHQESLHSHNATAVITKGVPNSCFNHHVTLGEWKSLQV